MIRYGIILLKNSCQRHRSGKNRVSFNWKLLPFDHMAYFNAIKKRHQFIPCMRTFNKNTVSVKINITVQIRNAAYRLLFPDTDADTVMRKPGNMKAFHKRHTLYVHPGMEQNCKNGIIRKSPPQSHLLHLFIRVTGGSHYLHLCHMKVGKEKDKSCQQNCPQGTQNRFLMFSIDQLHFQ